MIKQASRSGDPQPPPLPMHAAQGWKLRIPLRSFYVVAVCIIAICLPFFNDIVGLIGALGEWSGVNIGS